MFGRIQVIAAATIVAICFLGLSWVAPRDPIDWRNVYTPAALSRYPNESPGYFPPPWVAALLAPLAALPAPYDVGALYALSLLALLACVREPRGFLAVACLFFGQIDALLLVAFILPSWAAPLLFLGKPQGMAAALLNRLTAKTLFALAAALLLSWAVWGAWLAPVVTWQAAENLTFGANMAAFWPWTIPAGIMAAVVGARRKDDAWLCLASLCLSPYFNCHSMLPTVALFTRGAPKGWRAGLPCLLSWGYALLVASAFGVLWRRP